MSTWTYKSFVLTDDFEPDIEQVTDYRLRPHARWRIVIRAMGANRGPGATVAIFENAKSIGASIMYNSPGEFHFTLPVDDPQIAV
ncbi:MAG: hypothetical protein IH608_10870, partial [Proteobacteria bacterium]|nr:hypothetical protein [Pseudomonadota bacterium]